MRARSSGLLLEINASVAGFPRVDGPGEPDVVVTLGDLGPFRGRLPCPGMTSWYRSRRRDAAGRPELEIFRLPGGPYWLSYRDGTEFVVDAGATEVHATWAGPSTVEDTLAYLFGQVLGFLLRLRGVVALHGSAVVVGGHAVVITGNEAAGKSTTAAALARRGLPVLTDDIAALVDRGATFLVAPGPPWVMLLPASVQALWASADGRPPRLTPNWDKSCLDLTGPRYRYCRQPMPLGAIYLLKERKPELARPTFHAVSGSEALIQMVSNTYANRILDEAMRAGEFAVLTRMLAGVPVRRVHPPAGLDGLGALCEGILDDCRGLGLA